VTDFYDQLAEDYHLIFADWETAIAWQAEVIERLLVGHERQVRRVLDPACGIGTQALGLAAAGYATERGRSPNAESPTGHCSGTS
jgi:ubiquinone/menaquinone biosynthesis C-methylase UbiE